MLSSLNTAHDCVFCFRCSSHVPSVSVRETVDSMSCAGGDFDNILARKNTLLYIIGGHVKGCDKQSQSHLPLSPLLTHDCSHHDALTVWDASAEYYAECAELQNEYTAAQICCQEKIMSGLKSNSHF